MSTRSMTVLEGEAMPLRLYRHCDGYPAFAGKALADALSPAGTLDKDNGPIQATARLLRETYEATSYCAARPIYELAHWAPEQQGDLEHVYVARWYGSVGWKIEHRERTGWGPGGAEVWTKNKYTLPEFQAFTERERAVHDARAADYEKRRAVAQGGV